MPTLLFADRATASLLAAGGDLLTAGGLPCRNFAEWRTQPAWRNRQHGLSGSTGVPLLTGRGSAQAGTSLAWTIEAPPNTIALLAAGWQRVDLPLFGGWLVPRPDVVLLLVTDAAGTTSATVPLPPAFPAGLDLFSQAWLVDATGPQGFTATNALQCTTR